MNIELLNKIGFLLDEGKKGKWVLKNGKPYFIAAAVGSLIAGPVGATAAVGLTALGKHTRRKALANAAKTRKTVKSLVHK